MSKTNEKLTPSKEAEKQEWDIVSNAKTKVMVRDVEFKIGGIYYDTLDKITDIIENEKEEKRITAKCAAAIYLNGYFRLRLFYWLVWRWFYYVKQLTDEEMAPAVMELKKKAESARAMYYLNIISLTDVRQTMMAMTMDEAERFRRELLGGNPGQQPSVRKGE